MINSNRIMNPQAVTGIFGRMPMFNNSELLSVQIKRDGPTLFIQLSTKEIVKNKPKRWDEWDIVYIEMSFLGVKELEINSFGTINEIEEFEIEDIGEGGSIKIQCTNRMSITCLFDWARIEQINPGLIGTP
ncbi:Imm50 family immunity protein [Priestia aryabhattai]|uniref:Imm50 family immunity protein n=1 Tax=Priestia aryabhattai TaxID=412384 RepID=UPI003D269B14